MSYLRPPYPYPELVEVQGRVLQSAYRGYFPGDYTREILYVPYDIHTRARKICNLRYVRLRHNTRGTGMPFDEYRSTGPCICSVRLTYPYLEVLYVLCKAFIPLPGIPEPCTSRTQPYRCTLVFTRYSVPKVLYTS